jgi:hypothetical protein
MLLQIDNFQILGLFGGERGYLPVDDGEDALPAGTLPAAGSRKLDSGAAGGLE